ncbi:MAG: protein-disulfide reductase DsbD [Thiolinea sp.]
MRIVIRLFLFLSLLLLPLQAVTADDSLFGGLKSLTGGEVASGEPLDVTEAFVFGTPTYKGDKLTLNWTMPPDYYLYRDKFKITLLPGSGLSTGEPELPAGKVKEDPLFGKIEALYKFAEVVVPITRSTPDATELVAKVTWQGCMESLGICYPPESRVVKASLPAAAENTSTEMIELAEIDPESVDFNAPTSAVKQTKSGQASGAATKTSDVMLSEQDQIASMMSGDNTTLILLSFLGFGLLLSFTPCVFPMVPILSGIIAGQKNITPRKAFMLSLVYVLAMALTYTIAGVLAGLFGSNLQAALQNPWALGIFSAIFVLLALSMFGFYELQIPASMQSRLNEFSNRQAGGSFIGVAVMGILSALIVGPCVAAPLAGALIYIGMTGDAVLGGMALFALSIGMGIPLLIIGTLAGKVLPRAGQWMEGVKAVFGVMLLAVAIWMLERVLPMWLVMLLWAALLIISAIFMGALSTLSEAVSGWTKLWKGLGIMLLIHGALLMVGAATGGNDVFQPLKGIMNGAAGASVQKLPFRMVKGLDELQQAIDQAKGKPIMLDFYADWCVYCKDMEKNTFPDPAVRRALDDFVLLKADVTENDDVDKALQKHFKVIAPPAILFFGRDGQEIENLRLVGFMGPQAFASHVGKVE